MAGGEGKKSSISGRDLSGKRNKSVDSQKAPRKDFGPNSEFARRMEVGQIIPAIGAGITGINNSIGGAIDYAFDNTVGKGLDSLLGINASDWLDGEQVGAAVDLLEDIALTRTAPGVAIALGKSFLQNSGDIVDATTGIDPVIGRELTDEERRKKALGATANIALMGAGGIPGKLFSKGAKAANSEKILDSILDGSWTKAKAAKQAFKDVSPADYKGMASPFSQTGKALREYGKAPSSISQTASAAKDRAKGIAQSIKDFDIGDLRFVQDVNQGGFRQAFKNIRQGRTANGELNDINLDNIVARLDDVITSGDATAADRIMLTRLIDAAESGHQGSIEAVNKLLGKKSGKNIYSGGKSLRNENIAPDIPQKTDLTHRPVIGEESYRELKSVNKEIESLKKQIEKAKADEKAALQDRLDELYEAYDELYSKHRDNRMRKQLKPGFAKNFARFLRDTGIISGAATVESALSPANTSDGEYGLRPSVDEFPQILLMALLARRAKGVPSMQGRSTIGPLAPSHSSIPASVMALSEIGRTYQDRYNINDASLYY